MPMEQLASPLAKTEPLIPTPTRIGIGSKIRAIGFTSRPVFVRNSIATSTKSSSTRIATMATTVTANRPKHLQSHRYPSPRGILPRRAVTRNLSREKQNRPSTAATIRRSLRHRETSDDPRVTPREYDGRNREPSCHPKRMARPWRPSRRRLHRNPTLGGIWTRRCTTSGSRNLTNPAIVESGPLERRLDRPELEPRKR